MDKRQATGSGRRLDNDETTEAAWAATRGAVTGAARWGIYGAIGGGMGHAFSPLYRGLTFQFKVFLQMSAMVLGSMIEADSRLRQHELLVRREKALARDARVWQRFEAEFGPSDSDLALAPPAPAPAAGGGGGRDES